MIRNGVTINAVDQNSVTDEFTRFFLFTLSHLKLLSHQFLVRQEIVLTNHVQCLFTFVYVYNLRSHVIGYTDLLSGEKFLM